MLPYLIAGAIGFGIGKLFENGGETFMAGGRTNEDIIFEYPKDSNGRIMSWINVGTGNMEIASKTGTVGQVRDGHQLIVLKSETPNKVDYHILVDYLPEENKINMVRGKFNSEPSPKYQSYINDLFRMLKISQTTRDYQDEDIANQVYVKQYLINNFGNPPKGCQIKATELGVEIHFDSTNKMSSDWAMKIADKYGYPSGNFEMRYSSGNVPITYVDISKLNKNTSKSEKGYFNFGETFMAGGRITTNEDVLNSFLKSTKEVKANNLSTHFNEYDDFLLLRNYYTLIATRKGNDVKITNVKHSKTTSAITNRLKALAEEMGYNVSYVSKFENGGEMFMAGGIGESDDKYGGQINKIVTELKGMKGGLNNKAPYVFVKEGYIYVSAENGDNYADYYEYTIDEKLEDLADRYNTYWDWETAGSIVLAPIDTDAGGGETFMAGGRITKYVQLYFVQGNYGQGWEDLTAHDNRKDARAEMRVYDDNESYPHRVIQRRVLRTDYEKGKYVGGGEITDADLNYYIYPTKEVKIAYLGKIQMGYFFSLKDALKEIEYLTMAYPKNEIEKYAIITPDKTFHLGEKEYNIRFDNGGEAGGGLPKKRRRSASVQYGRSDTAVDKTRVAKPVGYRFTNAKANELRKDPYDKPTEAEVKKYLGKGIYKENRKRHSDKDRNAKL